MQTLEVQDTLEQRVGRAQGVHAHRARSAAKYYACWYYDDKDPDEATIVLDIKKVYVITDATATSFTNCADARPGDLDHIRRHRRRQVPTIKAQVPRGASLPRSRSSSFASVTTPTGERYQIRSGIVYAEGHGPPFYVAIGVPLAQNRRMLREFTLDLRRDHSRRADPRARCSAGSRRAARSSR